MRGDAGRCGETHDPIIATSPSPILTGSDSPVRAAWCMCTVHVQCTPVLVRMQCMWCVQCAWCVQCVYVLQGRVRVQHARSVCEQHLLYSTLLYSTLLYSTLLDAGRLTREQ